MRLSRRQQLFKLGRTALGKLIALVLRLEALVGRLRRRLRALHERVRRLERQLKELKGRLALNSTNSSKPPSSDGLAKAAPKPKSLRTCTGRRPGGQVGHPGRTLQPVPRPDHVRVHKLHRCPCGAGHGGSLCRQPVLDYEKRQVFELPQKPLEVTEHQAEIKRCPVSGRLVTAAFPEGVSAPAQYGPRFKAQMLYFNNEHFIPYQRLSRVCQDLYGQPLSEATVAAANQRTYEHLASFEQRLMTLLPQAPVNGCDESGLRVAKTLHWLHVVSNPALTFYGVHPKRGTEAMDDFGILPRCTQWLIHDHWKPYFAYDRCLHALCNEHHLRELKFLCEEHQEAWAQQMTTFLLDRLAWRKDHGVLDERQFKKVHARYRALLRTGRRRHPRRAGRAAQSKAANLLDRLEAFDLNVLAFTIFEEVPFTNNGAERDLRMEKTRQKVSGCFRTLHGARVFARIRSYISTCRKQDQNILDALERAVVGKPFMPSAPAKGP
jgi:transposase